MKGILSLYVNPEEMDPAEMREMIEEMESAIREQFTTEEIEVIRAHHDGFRQHERFLPLDVLEWATGYSKERLSKFQNEEGHPRQLSLIMRVLHERVIRDPEVARAAVIDWLQRKVKTDDPFKDVRSPDA
jgi:hypothetical protein